MATRNQQKGPTRRQREASRRAAAARRARLQWAAVIGVGVAIMAVVVVLSFQGQESQSGETAAESFDLPAIEGDDRVALGDFRGTPVVVSEADLRANLEQFYGVDASA